MTLKQHFSLCCRLELNATMNNEMWQDIIDHYAVGGYAEGTWFESIEEAKSYLEAHLDNEIELEVRNSQDFEEHIKVAGMHLVVDTISNTNEVYEAALRGEDLSKYGW